MSAGKTLVFVFFAMLSAFTLCAQKPITVAVFPGPDVRSARDGSDDRIKSLVNEYFKSELATHSRIKIAASEKIEEARKTAKFIPGQAPDPAEMKAFGEKTEAQILCIVTMPRNQADKSEINVAVFRVSDLKKMGQVSSVLENLAAIDDTCKELAQKAAFVIRGENRMDKLRELVTSPKAPGDEKAVLPSALKNELEKGKNNTPKQK